MGTAPTSGRCVTARVRGSARVVPQPLGLGPRDAGPDDVDVPPDLVRSEGAHALGQGVVEPGGGDLPGRAAHHDAPPLGAAPPRGRGGAPGAGASATQAEATFRVATTTTTPSSSARARISRSMAVSTARSTPQDDARPATGRSGTGPARGPG